MLTRVDRCPRADTRQAAGHDPQYAHKYALQVDHGPHADTRKAACRRAEWAYRYAREVDLMPREDTRRAAGRSHRWGRCYGDFEREYERASQRTTIAVQRRARGEPDEVATMRLGNGGRLCFYNQWGHPYLYTTGAGQTLCATCADKLALGAAARVKAPDHITGYRVWSQAQDQGAHCSDCAHEFGPWFWDGEQGAESDVDEYTGE